MGWKSAWWLVVVTACAGAGTSTSAGPSAGTSTGASAAASSTTSASASSVAFEMKAPEATTLADDLTAIGLDPKELPPLKKLKPDQLRKVMKLIAKSLGVKCTACHVWNSDGPPPRTARMNVAEQMWNHFVRSLTLAGGSPIFCDSCHHGSLQVLDRRDGNALAAWMKESFVRPLARVDHKEHGCATCHGEPITPRFIDLWKK